jgi:methionyl-tRNA formyltransferase
MVQIGFVGCHEISWHCLNKICKLAKKTNDNISIVFNLSEEERKKHSAPTQFETIQREIGFPLYNVKNVAEQENIDLLKKANLDILFIIGWHRIVPQSVLDTAPIRLGIHSSLLPKDRGSSPLNWSLIKNYKIGGVTLFHLTEGVDSGGIVDQEEFSIANEDYIDNVYYKVAVTSLYLLENNWDDIRNLKPKNNIQNEKDATYNERRRPDDGLMNWSQKSSDCYNFVRALSRPYPGAFTHYNRKKVFIWKAKINEQAHTKPGEIIDTYERLVVSTGSKSLEITELQIQDEPICDAKLFIKSYDVKNGDFFT